MSAIQSLTPQMSEYSERFTENGGTRWLPYLMYFNPANYRSDIVNTDGKGFRYTKVNGLNYSAAEHEGVKNTRLLAGNSMVFGMGATSDETTLSARMSVNDPKESNWVNFGSVAFNSTQELLLLVLYRHLLPKVDEIVFISGFNNLGLARLPGKIRGDHGAFYSSYEFFESMFAKNKTGLSLLAAKVLGKARQVTFTSETPSMDDKVNSYSEKPTVAEQIEYASDLTLQHLDMWRIIADDMGAKLTFMLQPLASWVRPEGSVEEERLFTELNEAGQFTENYGEILGPEVRDEYASILRAGADKMAVDFVDLNPLMRDALKPDQWVYADRIHLNDDGYELLSKVVLNSVRDGGIA